MKKLKNMERMPRQNNMSLPSLETLQRYLNYDSDTGEFVWKFRHDLAPKAASWNERNAGRPAGVIDGKGYLCIQIHRRKYRGHRIAWLMFYGQEPSLNIDHINGDKSDNRICNLREATVSQNGHNVGVCSRNTSGYRGVFWHKMASKWQAGLHFEGKDIYLGLFEKLSDAVAARRCAEIRYFGEFARAA